LSSWDNRYKPLHPAEFHYIFFQCSSGSSSQRNKARERNRSIQNRKEEVKLFMFVDGMVIYIENLKDTTENILELINSVRFHVLKSTHEIQ
jgi:hypothetical protein